MDIEKTKEKLLSERDIKPSPDGRYQDCWYWKKGCFSSGYGGYQNYRVHRLSAHLWLRFDIESELLVLHKCDNPPCFNPEHLFIGDSVDNNRDTVNKNRHRFNPLLGTLKGSEIGNSKLNESDVLEIRKLYQEGISRKELTIKFKISLKTIFNIIHNNTWKHVK